MLFHHDERPYEEAAASAASAARQKLEALIEGGRAKASNVIQYAQDHVPQDKIVNAQALVWTPTQTGLMVGLPGGGPVESFHRNAIRQAADDAGIPLKYVDRLVETWKVDPLKNMWALDLLADNFRKQFGHLPETKRFLLRSVSVADRREIRGFLSDKYRRLDSRPIIEAFAKACSEIGAIPVEGYVTDTKVAIKALIPIVFEPVKNEVLAVGVVLETSDFGNGALTVRAFLIRLWCTNYAIGEDTLRQVHLGKRLSDDMAFSQKTYELDTAATASAIGDVVKGTLAPDKVKLLMETVREADEQKIDVKKALEGLKKSLTKAEVDQVATAYNTGGVEMLPPGDTAWRFSNAISWVAGHETPDTERALEMMRLAAQVLPRPKKEE